MLRCMNENNLKLLQKFIDNVEKSKLDTIIELKKNTISIVP